MAAATFPTSEGTVLTVTVPDGQAVTLTVLDDTDDPAEIAARDLAVLLASVGPDDDNEPADGRACLTLAYPDGLEVHEGDTVLDLDEVHRRLSHAVRDAITAAVGHATA